MNRPAGYSVVEKIDQPFVDAWKQLERSDLELD
jgi:hypothetical protein